MLRRDPLCRGVDAWEAPYSACKSTLYLMMHEVGNIASFDSSTLYVRLKQSADRYSNMLKYLYEKAPRVYDAFCTLDMRQDSKLSR